MTEKWTPGEWRVEEDAYPHPPQITAGGILIAEVGNATDDYDAFLANAHLIKAAPALYRALEDATDILAALTFATIRIRGQYYPRGEIVESARAALAKARGEA